MRQTVIIFLTLFNYIIFVKNYFNSNFILTFALDKLKKENNMSAKGSITTAEFLPFTEYQRLLHCLENDNQYKWSLYCTLSFCFGLRVSDVLRLTWERVLNRTGLIVEEKKTKKVKSIPIAVDAQTKIQDVYQRLGCPKKSDYIFSNKDGKFISSQYINRLVKTWITKYNLPISNFSTHTFRKTFGRYVYEMKGRSEESLIILMHIFRHSDIRTTKIYIGLTDDEVGDIFSSIKL